MYDFNDIDNRIERLCKKRLVKNHAAVDRFVKDFRAYLCYYSIRHDADPKETLKLLEDDANLQSSAILDKNFCYSFGDLISKPLGQDPLFPLIFDVLLENKGKGVGVGELIMPFVVSGWSFDNKSDGRLANGNKIEVKNQGASMKPVKSGATAKGLVDELNTKYWNGTAPGSYLKSQHEKHLKEVKDPQKYHDYFTELYPGADVNRLSEEMLECYRDRGAVRKKIGMFVLRRYKEIDEWSNLIIIDAPRKLIVNIKDVEDIDDLELRFMPKMKRHKDTQAVPDGYCNIKFA